MINGKRINLRFASAKDMRLVYDMLVSEAIYDYMFNEEHPGPTWQEFREDEVDFFNGRAVPDGNYLLIEFNGKTAGAISYACGYEKKHYAEIDIWLEGNHLGLGIGAEAILTLREFVHNEYNIDEFIIRPWAKNTKAIKAYEKCGFHEDASLDLRQYYSDEDYEEYGEGDYGVEETVNLVMRYKERSE